MVKKPELQMPIHDGRLFIWDHNTRTGVCEMSQFVGKQVFSPVYRDGLDAGCYIFSPKTGVYKPFILHYTQCDIECHSTVLYWEFKSMDDGGKFTLKIFND